MKVCCPGSFDPITLGHLDVIERAAHLFGEVVVAVGNNTTKNYLLSHDERLELVHLAIADLDANVTVMSLPSGLLVDFCAHIGADAIIKGLRFGADFDYELQIAHVNAALASQVETILLPSGRNVGTISSTIVREIALNDGDITPFVPTRVAEAIKDILSKRTQGLD